MFQHTYKGSKLLPNSNSNVIAKSSSIPTRVRNFGAWYLGLFDLLVPAYLQGFETEECGGGGAGEEAFQHTYKGSKPVLLPVVKSFTTRFQHTYKGSKPCLIIPSLGRKMCSSIPTRVRNYIPLCSREGHSLLFQHTYKGSKLLNMFLSILPPRRSSIPTRVRN